MLRSVDQAGLVEILAVKAIVRPSGDQANSSAPPNGFGGLSASAPFMTSIGLPPPAGQTKRWLRLPSSQVSQWRNGSRVYSFAFTGLASASWSRFAVQARSGQSG